MKLKSFMGIFAVMPIILSALTVRAYAQDIRYLFNDISGDGVVSCGGASTDSEGRLCHKLCMIDQKKDLNIPVGCVSDYQNILTLSDGTDVSSLQHDLFALFNRSGYASLKAKILSLFKSNNHTIADIYSALHSSNAGTNYTNSAIIHDHSAAAKHQQTGTDNNVTGNDNDKDASAE